MIPLELLEPGMRVKIVDDWSCDCHQNPEGRMDKWLGHIMTVRKIDGGCVRMCEDEAERACGWCWYPAAIECIIIDEDTLGDIPNDDVQEFFDEILSIMQL